MKVSTIKDLDTEVLRDLAGYVNPRLESCNRGLMGNLLFFRLIGHEATESYFSGVASPREVLTLMNTDKMDPSGPGVFKFVIAVNSDVLRESIFNMVFYEDGSVALASFWSTKDADWGPRHPLVLTFKSFMSTFDHELYSDLIGYGRTHLLKRNIEVGGTKKYSPYQQAFFLIKGWMYHLEKLLE